MTGEKHHRKLLEGEGHVGSGAYKHLEKVGTEVRLCRGQAELEGLRLNKKHELSVARALK